VFGDPLSITIPDPDYDADEERFIIIGISSKRRLLVAVHTITGERARLISARLATKNESRDTKKQRSKLSTLEMRPEYAFSGGVRLNGTGFLHGHPFWFSPSR